VPTRLKRYYGTRHLHFITCSCYHRQPWLGSALRRDLFLRVFEQVRQRYGCVVVGYVVMPEHIHLLISEPEKGDPSKVMQSLKQGFARRLLRQVRRRGTAAQQELFGQRIEHVWQHRFYDFNVWSKRKRIEKLRYMHRNPVQRGLVAEPEQWRWSSFRSYAYGEAGRVRINQWGAVIIRPGAKAA
jgi:putative transposase